MRHRHLHRNSEQGTIRTKQNPELKAILIGLTILVNTIKRTPCVFSLLSFFLCLHLFLLRSSVRIQVDLLDQPVKIYLLEYALEESIESIFDKKRKGNSSGRGLCEALRGAHEMFTSAYFKRPLATIGSQTQPQDP